MDRIRIGILGAARIAPSAILSPAREIPEVDVLGIAARDPERARRFARKHRIPKVYSSYDELISAPEIDTIYNPLPNSLHYSWTLKALEAGKHVLLEKPFASNAEQAEALAQAAQASGTVLVEAFHYRYHPLAFRMQEIMESGQLGKIRRIETAMCVPLIVPGDIRYRFDLSGGAMMDVGSYAIHMLRFLSGEEPALVSAEARLSSPGVDRCMRAEFQLSDGGTAQIDCSLFSANLLKIGVHVWGESGELHVINPVLPQLYHRLELRISGKKTHEKYPGEGTYTHQLRAFARNVLEGEPVLTSAEDAVRNMQIIDDVYRKAGLAPRGIA